MQTIIGSGGAIGQPLAKELKKFTENIRLVSRNPVRINDTDELFPLDVMDFSRLHEAVEGSEVVYITIGFKYNLKVWRETWPPFMEAVINACKSHNSKLVFIDNIYMYDKSSLAFMTEDSPLNPPSKKGEVRKKLHDMIMNEVGKGTLNALIARSADFYGPVLHNSLLGEMVVNNLMHNKRPQAFGNIDRIHTYTFAPDAAMAAALLGNTPDAFGQVWHVPTTREKMTSRQWIELIGEIMHKRVSIQIIPDWMLHTLALFIPLMREFPEMGYQHKLDYVFDSSKFEKRFGIVATFPRDGITSMIKSLG